MSRRALSFAVLALALTPGVAAAQSSPEPGVHVDPNSPTQKEYAIPLAEARRNATPSGVKKAAPTTSSQQQGTSTGAVPLFGAGIKPEQTKSKAKHGSTKTTSTSTAAADDSSDDTTAADAAAIAAASGSGGGGGGGGLAAPIGIGLLILAVGGGIGFLAKRRSSAAARGQMRAGSSEL